MLVKLPEPQSHAKNPLAALPAAAETCRCLPERGMRADACAVVLGLGKLQSGSLSPSRTVSDLES